MVAGRQRLAHHARVMKRPGNLLVAVVGVGAVAAVLSRVGLSRIVSKYVGETERDLDSTIEAAERSDAALGFDESDALFGDDPAADEHDPV
jgi:SpoVK/Ycf46/Vps4 family AAA+-type ATPase